MSRTSNLELSSPDSQVLGPLDSQSLPSEPPDIRNWFSSYVYESPELDTADGFQDFDGSTETSPEEDVKEKSDGIGVVGKLDDECVTGAKGLSDGNIVEFNESDEFEHRKPALVSGLSESLSQCSEPPDIKNWFSSYVYESPTLDTVDFFTSDCKERENSKVSNTLKKACNDKDVSDIGDISVLPSQSSISDVGLKCTNLVEYANQGNQSVCKDGCYIDLEPRSSAQSQWTSEIKKDDVDYNANLENNSYCPDGKSLCKSVERKDCMQDGLEKEDFHKNESPEENSSRRPTARSNGKENEATNITEDGFISTRKNTRQSSDHYRRMQVGNQLQSKTNGAKPESGNKKDAKMSRKALSETTNIRSPNALEITGKWRCPQKHKPNLGPPLKQLRLEQWVRLV